MKLALASSAEARLAELAYELLDAHVDTAALAAELANDDERWALHLAYLRDLQRAAREQLARSASGGTA